MYLCTSLTPNSIPAVAENESCIDVSRIAYGFIKSSVISTVKSAVGALYSLIARTDRHKTADISAALAIDIPKPVNIKTNAAAKRFMPIISATFARLGRFSPK